MLDVGRYLLGVAEIALLVGFAWLSGTAVRAWLVPRLEGAPAHLATAVLALALLIWMAEALGAFGLLDPVPYLLLMGIAGMGFWTFLPRVASWRGSPAARRGVQPRAPWGMPRRQDPRAGAPLVPTLIALLVAALAVIRFVAEAKPHLSTGMTGFDSTWYHGPFAAGFFQSGDTWSLHFIAPQFLAWFYPANSEIFHAVGMLAFGRDILSPLLSLGWFLGCLLACWCIGRPYEVAPWSLLLGAVALSVPALSDQAGEARNDIVGIFFLLGAVAIALNAAAVREDEGRAGGEEGAEGSAVHPWRGLPVGAAVVAGLSAGLAAGTKLNFLLPTAVLVIGLVALAPHGARWRALAAAGLAALAGGGYWYLRNLVQAGNPLPWIDGIGPISLPAPDQALGGREAHSVLGYLTDGAVWSDWFLPGLRDGLWIVWPLLVAAALAGLLLALHPRSWPFRGSSSTSCVGEEPRNGATAGDPILALAGLVGFATALAWLVAPTSASGPDGMPRGFESGLRYLAPALVLGLALLPAAPAWRGRLADTRARLSPHTGDKRALAFWGVAGATGALAVGMLVIAAGYPVQRHYLQSRYENPSFTAPGLNAAFAWAREVSGARIATTSTRQYPLFGTDLSNHVELIGEERPHGGFEAPTTCRAWRQALNEGGYDYVVATRDRLEPGKPPYPPQARWTEGLAAKPILKKPPTVVFQLTGTLDPSACPD
jgi:hypothetical protein